MKGLYPMWRSEFRLHEGNFVWVLLRKDKGVGWKVVVAMPPAETLADADYNMKYVEWLESSNNYYGTDSTLEEQKLWEKENVSYVNLRMVRD